jgi:hypothetical protein
VNFVKSVFSGPSTFQEAQAKIKVAIETYTSTIVDLGAVIGLQLFKQGKHIEEKIDNLSTQFFQNVDNRFIGFHAFSAADSQSRRKEQKKNDSKLGYHTRREQIQASG